VVELWPNRLKAGLDIAQAFAKRQLSERQAKKLIATRKPARPSVASVPSDASVELVPRKKLHELRENQFAVVHQDPSSKKNKKILLDFGLAS